LIINIEFAGKLSYGILEITFVVLPCISQHFLLRG